MNVYRLVASVFLIGLNSSSVSAQFIQGAADSLQPDVVSLVVTAQAGQTPENVSVKAELYVTNDGNNVTSGGMGFSWDNPKLRLDSAVATPLTVTAFDFMIFMYYKNDLGSSNANRRFLFAGARKTTAGVLAQPNSKHWATYYFTYLNWISGESFTIDKSEYNNGAKHQLVETYVGYYAPYWEGGTTIVLPISCCVGLTGNVDNDPNDIVDISDHTLLIDHLFINFTPLECPKEADMDFSGTVDMADLNILTDHLFINFTPLDPCQ